MELVRKHSQSSDIALLTLLYCLVVSDPAVSGLHVLQGSSYVAKEAIVCRKADEVEGFVAKILGLPLQTVQDYCRDLNVCGVGILRRVKMLSCIPDRGELYVINPRVRKWILDPLKQWESDHSRPFLQRIQKHFTLVQTEKLFRIYEDSGQFYHGKYSEEKFHPWVMHDPKKGGWWSNPPIARYSVCEVMILMQKQN